MDGHFVPNMTIGPPVVKALKHYAHIPFDVHLMISNPDDFIEPFIASGADYLSVHLETCPHLHKTLQAIKQGGAKAGVALNPGTSFYLLDDDMFAELDFILVMTVNPGFGGQQFIPFCLSKVQRLRRRLDALHLEHVEIEVDGGISLDNIHEITEAGATMIVAGSAIFKAPDPAEMIRQMKAKCVMRNA
jgi:ribulose-phosphate 3-epimerase